MVASRRAETVPPSLTPSSVYVGKVIDEAIEVGA